MLETNSSAAILDSLEDTADRELVITRLFDASREMLFDAFSDPVHIEQWWGPNGFTTTTEKFDFRVGGEWIHVMHGPDGTDYPNRSVFLEIVRPERIVRTHGNGKDLIFHNTVTFTTEGDQTRVTLRHVFPTAEMLEYVVRVHHAREGGQQTLARLAEYIARPKSEKDYVLHITRMLDAPRDLVYEAFTNPAMLSQWFGPRGFTAMDIEYDVRAGGKWSLRLHKTSEETGCDAGDATDLYQYGTYLEVAPPERLVYTFAWKGSVEPLNYETKITVTFRELEGKTVMDFKQGPFKTEVDRDNHNVGWSSAFDKFAEFLLAPVGAEKTHDLVIEREFDAPRDLVWKVWTDPAMAKEWAGPRGFTATHMEQDARVGGKWRLCLHSDGFDQGDGVLREQNLWQGGEFREIVPPERVVYTFAWDNPADVGLDLKPHETLITITFAERGNKTAMTFRQEFFLTAGERDGHNKGWNSAFDKFAELVHAEARQA
jgi:uncharacterized protein YndB with AHSA1/START domain